MRSKLNWTAITCCTIRWRTRKSTWTKSSHCWPQSTTHSVNQWRVRPAKENSSSKWRKSSPPSGKTRIRFGFSFENLSTIFFFLFNNSHFFFFSRVWFSIPVHIRSRSRSKCWRRNTTIWAVALASLPSRSTNTETRSRPSATRVTSISSWCRSWAITTTKWEQRTQSRIIFSPSCY